MMLNFVDQVAYNIALQEHVFFRRGLCGSESSDPAGAQKIPQGRRKPILDALYNIGSDVGRHFTICLPWESFLSTLHLRVKSIFCGGQPARQQKNDADFQIYLKKMSQTLYKSDLKA